MYRTQIGGGVDGSSPNPDLGPSLVAAAQIAHFDGVPSIPQGIADWLDGAQTTATEMSVPGSAVPN